MDIATFRSTFPEFASIDTYTDATVTFWLDMAPLRVSEERFGTTELWPYMQCLFVAHNLALMGQASRGVAMGGAPGRIMGPQSSKTVDRASVTYDTAAITLEGAGAYNATIYGVQLWQFMRWAGAGGLQL